jgi:hypothetical protein
MSDPITPRDVLQSVASAIPQDLRGDIIIVGSLAAAYQLLRDHAQTMRTKDVDSLVAPHAKALSSAARVTQDLISKGWVPEADKSRFDLPGRPDSPVERLPVVRLQPPQNKGWFLELLGAPPSVGAGGRGSRRLETPSGHFELPSFAYLGLVQYEPTASEFGVMVAKPEMMALANLLHHPTIDPKRMSQAFGNRSIKRSNKDLGRVVALAILANMLDEDALESWSATWEAALQALAPDEAGDLITRAPSGLHALLASPADIEEALWTVNNGLLSDRPVTAEAFVIGLRRLLDEVG